ncbi:hypothetical protein M413DRAFT_117045 [Hebeloma cylindrosporum]|uniref:Uncharacterized protein n=1 Tax=Hebeloma cylindrosporum TaxID=76867 RepID=A0A0C2YJ95_HEBCY|nr:hypothetical protein M413DRAFT_117045 [Hebeloma cylindrosporum h7]
MFDLLPFLKRVLRWLVYIWFELLCFGIYTNKFLRKECEKRATWYIKNTAPKKYHDKLIPTFREYPFPRFTPQRHNND